MKSEIALLIIFASLQVASAKYFFSDQAHWMDDDPGCGGEEQSPIDIITKDVIHDSALDEPFTFSDNFLDAIENVTCKNTGQSYTCTLVSPSVDRTMQGGNLIKAPFKLVQFHVHFGSASSYKGSEHQVNSYQYPAEIHFVFLDADLGSISEVSTYGDLAVWGFFIETLPNTVKKGSLAEVLDEIARLTDYEDSVDLVNTINLSEMIPVNNFFSMGSFYRYKGGLTTPACNEVVQWTVFKNPLYISEAQYLKMTGGQTWPNAAGNPVIMVDTFRYPQPLNGRLVTRTSFAADGSSTTVEEDLATKVSLQSSAICLAIIVVTKLFMHYINYQSDS